MKQFKFKIDGIIKNENPIGQDDQIVLLVTVYTTRFSDKLEKLYELASLFRKPAFISAAMEQNGYTAPGRYVPIVVDDIKLSYILSRIASLIEQQLGVDNLGNPIEFEFELV